MRPLISICLLIFVLASLSGCALGKKEWPVAQESEDTFTFELVMGDRQENCLSLEINVNGAVNRLYRASIQYEVVGGDDGEGCIGCPFVPRDAIHFTRNQSGFDLNGGNLRLSFCGLDP